VWGALRRVRATGAQARLRRSERLRNQRQAYGLNGAFDVRGRRLLIIDDVLTTGATANACAQMLRAAGALEICALTVARG
jgi:predicted amidophosphoribosyltransferase